MRHRAPLLVLLVLVIGASLLAEIATIKPGAVVQKLDRSNYIVSHHGLTGTFLRQEEDGSFLVWAKPVKEHLIVRPDQLVPISPAGKVFLQSVQGGAMLPPGTTAKMLDRSDYVVGDDGLAVNFLAQQDDGSLLVWAKSIKLHLLIWPEQPFPIFRDPPDNLAGRKYTANIQIPVKYVRKAEDGQILVWAESIKQHFIVKPDQLSPAPKIMPDFVILRPETKFYTSQNGTGYSETKIPGFGFDPIRATIIVPGEPRSQVFVRKTKQRLWVDSNDILGVDKTMIGSKQQPPKPKPKPQDQDRNGRSVARGVIIGNAIHSMGN